ncbi:Thioredoxin-related protein [Fodinibius roseus]|uniref:Thioredoxin-related protein n=2 Tax=Fodinibius roseus TaxID=1194090 RepID=A0A1M4UU36_9BACT|nr:Thioredoxin-related protein [Fodinibius roseus]
MQHTATGIRSAYGIILLAVYLSISLLLVGLRPAHSQELQWLPFEKALATADSSNRPVLVDIWAPWCGWCRKLKKEVYPALAPEWSGQFVLTRVNRDDREAVHHYRGQKLSSLRLAQKLGARQVPSIVFLNARGKYLLHVTGFLDAKSLEPLLAYIATGAYHRQSFETFQKESGF